MLYSIGASYNPGMSEPNRTIQRGLAGIKGLSFAYRLNTWGLKQDPPMLPANTFPKAMIPPSWGSRPSLASPLTWIEGVFGIEAASDMVTDAANGLSDILSQLTGAQTNIQTLLAQAQSYGNSSDTSVQSKSQACQSEAAGLLSTLQALQSSAQNIQTQITVAQADPNVTKDTAQNVKNAVSALSDQLSSFQSGMTQLQKDINDLKGTAQSGPGVTGFVEDLVSSNVSKLTWIVGGGLMIYLLAPSFIPRLARGVRKS